MPFRDLFSERAPLYARYRPSYPDELFAWLARIVPRTERVWDCATGNGQAARGLAQHFREVVATDASDTQIAAAEPLPGIEYRVATAYDSGLPDSSVDLVTVAQAMHWFEPERFYPEARRVLRDGGAIAVWGYADAILDDAELERIVHDYNRGTVESYWMPERKHLLNEYRTIAFPFREIETPRFEMIRHWNLEELAGYLRTWSATAAYARVLGRDPIIDVEAELAKHWGEKEERHTIRWPLFIRAGYDV